MAKAFLERVRLEQPTVIVATHFFPAVALAEAKQFGWLTSRVVVVVTDLFPHRLWLTPEADAFVVGSEEVKAVCQQRGIAEARIHPLGIPIAKAFRHSPDKGMVRERLRLDPARQTLLIVSGGEGMGPMSQLVRHLVTLEAVHPKHLQLLVVCGSNVRLRETLDRVAAASTMPMRVFGFVDTMPELMGVSDLLLTKPGGLTVMEALAMGLPMIFFNAIPGQERFNADYVIRHGAGLNAAHPAQVKETVLRLLDHPAQLDAMRSRALSLAKPTAAQQLVETLIAPATHGTA